jgi:hypothetical protein
MCESFPHRLLLLAGNRDSENCKNCAIGQRACESETVILFSRPSYQKKVIMGRGNSAKRNESNASASTANAVRINDKRLREALERDTIQLEGSAARIENEIYHKELARAIPWKVIFSGLSDYEKQLLRLSLVDEMSAKQVALVLGSDTERIKRDLNRARARIRDRVKSLLQKDDAANKLMLAWEQIRAKRNRIAS